MAEASPDFGPWETKPAQTFTQSSHIHKLFPNRNSSARRCRTPDVRPAGDESVVIQWMFLEKV